MNPILQYVKVFVLFFYSIFLFIPFTVLLCKTEISFDQLAYGLHKKVFKVFKVLRSAVGKTHDWRSDLWWTIPLRILLDRFGIPFGFHTIKSALARHSGVQVPVISRQRGHVVSFPYPTYGSTWVVLWLLFCRSAPSTFPVTRSTFKGPFRGVPSH